MDKQNPKKTTMISIACRSKAKQFTPVKWKEYETKFCDACCLGWGILWVGDPPNDTYKLGKCYFCNGKS